MSYEYEARTDVSALHLQEIARSIAGELPWVLDVVWGDAGPGFRFEVVCREPCFRAFFEPERIFVEIDADREVRDEALRRIAETLSRRGYRVEFVEV